uniref:Uncharacterized protein n=1 Tax=Romanomermis culicivorax TaxID=13658 RepID=A0A915I5G4_ROMCU
MVTAPCCDQGVTRPYQENMAMLKEGSLARFSRPVDVMLGIQVKDPDMDFCDGHCCNRNSQCRAVQWRKRSQHPACDNRYSTCYINYMEEFQEKEGLGSHRVSYSIVGNYLDHEL